MPECIRIGNRILLISSCPKYPRVNARRAGGRQPLSFCGDVRHFDAREDKGRPGCSVNQTDDPGTQAAISQRVTQLRIGRVDHKLHRSSRQPHDDHLRRNRRGCVEELRQDGREEEKHLGIGELHDKALREESLPRPGFVRSPDREPTRAAEQGGKAEIDKVADTNPLDDLEDKVRRKDESGQPRRRHNEVDRRCDHHPEHLENRPAPAVRRALRRHEDRGRTGRRDHDGLCRREDQECLKFHRIVPLLRENNKGSFHPRSQPIKTVPLGMAVRNGPSCVAQRNGATSRMAAD